MTVQAVSEGWEESDAQAEADQADFVHLHDMAEDEVVKQHGEAQAEKADYESTGSESVPVQAGHESDGTAAEDDFADQFGLEGATNAAKCMHHRRCCASAQAEVVECKAQLKLLYAQAVEEAGLAYYRQLALDPQPGEDKQAESTKNTATKKNKKGRRCERGE